MGNTMSDETEGLSRLFRAAGGEHNPADCDECRAHLPSLVEAEMAGEDVSKLYSQALAHLDTCADCDEEYAALLDLALAEERGELPQPTTYPALKLPRAIRMQRVVRQVAQAVLGALNPQRAQELAVVTQTFFEQLAESPGRLTLREAASLPMGLGGRAPETLRAVMAAYYALNTLLEKHSVAELKALVEQGGLEPELRTIARAEAKLNNLRGGAEKIFVDTFVKQILDGLPTLLELSSSQ